MITLNTLRTKGGVIVTLVIFIALLAFLVGDIFGSGGSMFNSRKMRVGEIDDNNVGYVEFLNESDHISNVYRLMWGRDAMSGEEQEMIYDAAWEQFMMRYSYLPSFESMGLGISEAEQVDMVNGSFISPVIMQTFMNPNTGMYDPQLMKNFLSQANQDDNAYAIWNFIRKQMSDNRIMTKFTSLVQNGFYVTDTEVTAAVKSVDNAYGAILVSKPYYQVADSLVNISDNQIREYYKTHKQMFKQTPSRDLEYVVFDIMPSEADYLNADKYIMEIAEDFLNSDSPMQYATLNSQEKPDLRYYREDELTPEVADIAFGREAGNSIYGPSLNGDVYTISRLSDTKVIPDSLGAKHILLNKEQTALADSLVTVIRRGSDFEELARKFSLDRSVVQNGGDLGRFAPEEMVTEFSDAALEAKVRDVYTVESQFGIHVVQLTYKSRPVKKAQVATITYKVDPSEATIQNIYTQASTFVSAANGTADGFKQAVSDEALSKRSIRVRNTDRTISGLENPKELIRWAYNNNKGAVSSILEIDGDYLVAALTDVREDEFTPVSQVSNEIRETLRNEAKARIIAEQLKGPSIDIIAAENDLQIEEVVDVQFNSFYLPEIGVEPKLIGALSNSPVNTVSKPVSGYSGVYVFSVQNVENSGSATAEGERARLEANAQYYMSERTMQALYEESNVNDMRVKFF